MTHTDEPRDGEIAVLRDRALDHLERAAVCLATAADIAQGTDRIALQDLVHRLRIDRRDVMGTP